ncbi:type 2 lanthipeptide synthetase LanM [Rhizohabitans arisaemae]|uniref:type 2 lanthipeptide synthetase LanM n=1 Tax=Rhizohabitans arisaemae TaxID=2720610 RepID=UPI0024B138E8|nr:type 2 lanthipeptide synthetase LanM [Rhizohabitans arisaemae]
MTEVDASSHADPAVRDRVRAAIRAQVRDAVRIGPSCPPVLTTDCCLWPHLAVALEGFSEAASAAPAGVGPALKRAFLQALAVRLDLSARQALLFECALAREQRLRDAPGSMSELSAALQRDAGPLIGILDVYPALDELLADHVRCSVEYACKVAAALTADREEVAARFGWAADPAGIEIEVLASDHHCGGETIVRLGDRGGRGRVLFKPRSLHLEELLTAGLAELSGGSPLLRGWRLPGYLVRAGHGWAEYVGARPCADPGQVARYYGRAGFLIAYATALGITDLHCDNLICHADSPVPVDLETALHHRQRPGAPSRGGMTLPRVMEWNALATGLLPTWIWKGGDRRGVDLSGLGSLGEQWCSLPLQQFTAAGTPLERIVRDGVHLMPSRNTVYLDGRPVAPWAYLEELLDGFRIGVGLLAESAPLVAGLVEEGSRLEARFLARPTAGYHYATQASLHPRYLRDAGERREFLTDALTDVSRVEPWLVTAEVDACLAGDIPRFTTRGGDPAVREPYYGGHGALSEQEHIPGRDAVADDLRHWSDPARLTFEHQIISGSMLSLRTAHESEDPRHTVADGADQGPAEWEPGLGRAAAEASAGFLLDYLAASGDDPDLWYGFRNAPGGHHEFGLIGGDLYCGTAGVAYGLALGHRAGFVGRDTVETLTRRLAESAEARLKAPTQRLGGAYFGELSAVLPLVAVLCMLGARDEGRRLGRAGCHALVQGLAEPAPQRHFWGTDLLGGTAGALAVMTSLHRILGDEDYLPPSRRLIGMLDEYGRTAGDRIVWRQPAVSASPDQALGGLSHGQAGHALALAEAAAVLDGSSGRRAAELAVAACGWELDLFDPAGQTFPDVRRRSTVGGHGEFAWSHGAPGIVVALDRVRRCVPAPEVDRFLAGHPFREMVEAAVATRPTPNNPSLCHGALGAYLIGVERTGLAAELADWTRLGSWARREALPLRRWTVEAPGLMVGRAGSLAGWSAAATGCRRGLPFLPSAFAEVAG